MFFASMFVWRDAIELRIADTLAIITILGVLFLPTLKISAKVAGVVQYAIGIIWAALNSCFAPWALLGADIRWNRLSASGWQRHAFSVLRGILIAAPLVLIFGGLFMAADAVYEGWIKSVFNVDFENLISHGILVALFAWLTAGYFRGAIFAGVPASGEAPLSILADEISQPAESRVDQMRAESGEHAVVLPDSKTVVEHINLSDPPDTAGEAGAQPVGSSADESREKKTWSWAQIDNSVVPGFTLGAVEIGVILGLLNLLFLSFVIVQVPYLFGGMELVRTTPDFKLAEYARRGFGELVAVSALVLPILLASHWLVRKDAPVAGRLFRVLAGLQIVLLFVIMASAVQRLLLLTGNLGYGMTTVRLYPLIFMVWLAVIFVWFGATVLRGARQYFAWGALWSAFFVLGAVHILNPDEFIVRTNLALMREGRPFDARYNSGLSDDAVPVLVDAFVELSEPDQVAVLKSLAWRNCEKKDENDLRSWNVSRQAAVAALSAYRETLGQHTPNCERD